MNENWPKTNNDFNPPLTNEQMEQVQEVINQATIRGVFGSNFQITGVMANEARELALLLRAGDEGTGLSAEMQTTSTDLGVLGLAFPENVGGSGLGAFDRMYVSQTLGRHHSRRPRGSCRGHCQSSAPCLDPDGNRHRFRQHGHVPGRAAGVTRPDRHRPLDRRLQRRLHQGPHQERLRAHGDPAGRLRYRAQYRPGRRPHAVRAAAGVGAGPGKSASFICRNPRSSSSAPGATIASR